LNMVKNLIVKGGDVNERDSDGYTPLCSASAEGHLEIAKILIEEGADIESTDTMDALRLF